ncbi:GIY-YIG nuclease family protein [Candidatus Gracilibacteria bacterium]|nr:GIY-YIG nuclease family protein [Candidatus Gracilibacteria bacterium]
MKNYYVYILSSQHNNTLYIGVTGDISRRITEHKEKMIDGFSKRYNCTKLVFVEVFEDIEYALLREKQLKKWSRSKKDFLIMQNNPNFIDLSTTL